jgi:hypothetical protein
MRVESKPVQRGAKKKTKRNKRPRLPFERTAYSIDEFADANGLSPAMVYKLWTLGQGPDVMRVGRRRLISFEAAERWRRQREAAANNAGAAS